MSLRPLLLSGFHRHSISSLSYSQVQQTANIWTWVAPRISKESYKIFVLWHFDVRKNLDLPTSKLTKPKELTQTNLSNSYSRTLFISWGATQSASKINFQNYCVTIAHLNPPFAWIWCKWKWLQTLTLHWNSSKFNNERLCVFTFLVQEAMSRGANLLSSTSMLSHTLFILLFI